MARYKQPWAEIEADIMANSRGGDMDYQLDEARQMWDMDSTPVAPQTRRETIQEAFNEPAPAPASVNTEPMTAMDALAAYNAETIPDGMTSEAYRDSRLPPKTPWDEQQADIIGTELGYYKGQSEGGGGDRDYEIDSARQQWEMNPERDRINKEFLAKGDNAKWYNPDMSRTDYAGKYAPSLDVQRQTARNTYGNSAAPDLTPAPAAKTAPPPAPPMAPAGPTPTMQAFQAARLRKAAAPINFTPTQAVSGYESGGWDTGGTSNG